MGALEFYSRAGILIVLMSESRGGEINCSYNLSEDKYIPRRGYPFGVAPLRAMQASDLRFRS